MTEIPKTATLGATSFVGSALFDAYRELWPDCVGTSRRDLTGMTFLDFCGPPQSFGKSLRQSGHQQAVILAAEPNVARCEANSEAAHAVNVTGTLALVDQLLAEDIFPIFISSDYVFDGVEGAYTEDADTEPTTQYGLQKREAEQIILQRSGGRCLIVRLSKMYGLHRGDGTLFDEMANLLHGGKTVRAASDQLFNPMYLPDFPPALQAIQAAGVHGIVHICGDQAWPRARMARQLAEAMEVDRALVQEISLDDLGLAPTRPKNTSMDNSLLRTHFTSPVMLIEDAIKRVAQNYKA